MAELFARSEAGARGLRENRRNDAQRQPGLAAKRGLQRKQSGALNENYQCENSHVPAGRLENNSHRSPRLSSFATANRSFGGMRGGLTGGVMSDITNVTAGRASLADKAKPFKPSQHSFQPPATATTRESTTRDLPPAPILSLSNALAADFAAEEKAAASVLHDPQSVQEYAPDIINQFFSTEALALPRADYMDNQTDITGKMRMILMDWLIEVHMKYRLCPETLHLAVNLIDRYLSKKQITRERLQLVGVAAMFIASKFEEISPPELPDWVYITDNAYTKDDVLKTECDMLTTLSFKIVVPTAAHFFEHLAVANGCDSVHRSCAQYLLELGLLDTRVLACKPSHLVSAALLLSNELFTRKCLWPEAMINQSRHSEQQLRHCAQELRQLWKADRAGAGGQLQAVHRKFSTPQRHSVATLNF